MNHDDPNLDSEAQPHAVMAHIFFCDIVGFAKLANEDQLRHFHRLSQIVRGSPEFSRARDAGQLVCSPTGDGVAIAFFDDARAPARCAIEVSQALRRDGGPELRMGLHSGHVYRVTDINGRDNIAGTGVNLAQRVMDCGDAGHILLSDVQAGFLKEFADFRPHLRDLGETEVKHGVKLHLSSYCGSEAGNSARPGKLVQSKAGPARCAGKKVALVYKRGAQPDEVLLAALEKNLRQLGCEVSIDRHLRIGLDWAREIERVLRDADAVIPLLSPSAAGSEMLAMELEIVDEAAQRQGGKPQLLPIRVNWEGPLPTSLAPLLDPIQYYIWRGPEDTAAVTAQIAEALSAPPVAAIRRSRQLEPPGGAMPLDSPYYIERTTDAELHNALSRRDSIVLVEGARQMGKTSLLARGLQRARGSGAKVACTDFQKFNLTDLATLETFYLTLGSALANQLDLEKSPDEVWHPKRGPNENFERYIRREVLGRLAAPLVWALDEADRLFTCPFGSEVFGLFRSWHNARALDPESPWHRFTQVICYATEAHLFITDINQSPFNVGTRVALRDFSVAEVKQLNHLYGEPLRDDAELSRFHMLLGGQPYLVRRGLHEMVAKSLSLDQLATAAIQEDGPFADHLKRYLVLLSRDPMLLQAVRDTLHTHKFPEAKNFHRLRAAGLLRGASPADAGFRCEIYEAYLQRHLVP